MPVPNWSALTQMHIAPNLKFKEIPFTLDNSDLVSILEGNPFEVVAGVAGKLLVVQTLAARGTIIEPYLVNGGSPGGDFLRLKLGDFSITTWGFYSGVDFNIYSRELVTEGVAADFVGASIYITAKNSGGVVTGGDAGNSISGSLSIAIHSV